jgi:phospholipase/carboxylesterase
MPIHDTPPDQDIIFHQGPETDGGQLMLLFHGYGGSPRDFLPLVKRLRQAFPQAWIIGVAGPQPAASGTGRQWYDAQHLNDDQRIERVRQAMPEFVRRVHTWQQHTGVARDGIALVGFSQGGIMALESTQHGHELAGRIITIGSRFAGIPTIAPAATTLHLFHGKTDTVVPYSHTIQAAEQLLGLGADLTADVIPGIGHQIASDIREQIVQRLRTHIPKRVWEEAMRAAGARP